MAIREKPHNNNFKKYSLFFWLIKSLWNINAFYPQTKAKQEIILNLRTGQEPRFTLESPGDGHRVLVPSQKTDSRDFPEGSMVNVPLFGSTAEDGFNSGRDSACQKTRPNKKILILPNSVRIETGIFISEVSNMIQQLNHSSRSLTSFTVLQNSSNIHLTTPRDKKFTTFSNTEF